MGLQSIKAALGRSAVPLARLYIRYLRFAPGRRFVWDHVGWRGRSYVTRTRHGVTMAGRTGDVVQGYIYYFGMWEPNLTAFVLRRLEDAKDRTFVDVGANVGYFSLLAATRLHNGKVVSIEAFPRTFELLTRNVALNRSGEIRTVCCAVTDVRREVEIFYAGSANEGGTTTVAGRFAAEPVRVPGIPLDDVLTAEEVATIRLIKIDVEGAEGSVLRGMTQTMTRLPQDAEIVIEITPSILGDDVVASIFSDMARRGYHPYALPNSYSVDAYMSPTVVVAPKRMHTLPREQSDVVFSRVDAPAL